MLEVHVDVLSSHTAFSVAVIGGIKLVAVLDNLIYPILRDHALAVICTAVKVDTSELYYVIRLEEELRCAYGVSLRTLGNSVVLVIQFVEKTGLEIYVELLTAYLCNYS